MNKKLYKTNMNYMTNSCKNNSFCKVPSFMPDCPEYANNYVPYQMIDEIYTPECALEQGTLFPELADEYQSGQGYMQLMELYMEGGMQNGM